MFKTLQWNHSPAGRGSVAHVELWECYDIIFMVYKSAQHGIKIVVDLSNNLPKRIIIPRFEARVFWKVHFLDQSGFKIFNIFYRHFELTRKNPEERGKLVPVLFMV